MQMPRALGIVATAFLALGLGIGVGGAAMSGHHASSDISQNGAAKNGTLQWDDSNAQTAPANVDPAFSRPGKADGKDPWQGDGKDHGRDASPSKSAWTSSRSSNDNGTKQPLKSDQWVKWVSFFANHPGDSGNGSNGVVSRHGSNDTSTDRRSKPVSKITADASKANGAAELLKQKQAVPDVERHKGASGGTGISPKGSNKNGTRPDAPSEATPKKVNISEPISAWEKGSGQADVTDSNDAETTAKPSNRHWTDWFGQQDPEVWRSGHGKCKPITVDGEKEGDGGGDVRQDGFGGPHASSDEGDGFGEDAGRWQASRSEDSDWTELS